MNINIKAKNLELTEPLRVFIEKKMGSLSKLLMKWEKEKAATLDFEVARTTRHHHKGDVYYAEANLKLGRGETIIRAERDSDNVREAINMVKEVLKEEVKKYKKKKEEMNK